MTTNYLRTRSKYTPQQDTGFTLIEMLVVVVMIGILSAIVAPSWLGFVNRQRLNKAHEEVVTAIKQVQEEAKKKKVSYSISLRKNTTTQAFEFAIYPTKKSNGTVLPTSEITTWQKLGADTGLNAKQFLLGSNITDAAKENTAASTSLSYSLTAPAKITFDYMGNLPNANFGTVPTGSTEAPGLKVVVALPSPSNSALPSSMKRCVIIKTLLGSMITQKDDKCS
ncbi:pilus assembly FimT family protein [Anabaena sp. WFMT]|uniref:pilus assembly FimT family protein n=1 Tax=Anabaena sp. WFMT TaxID=3449730 RepID=UPI003F24E3A5